MSANGCIGSYGRTQATNSRDSVIRNETPMNQFVRFHFSKKKKTSNNSMLRQCALGVLDTRSRRPRRWMCMHACSTFAWFRRSSLCDLFSRLFEKYIVQCTFRFGWIKFNLKCGFPVRSHLCAVIASKHLEFAYTHSQHSRVREKRRQKKTPNICPYLIIDGTFIYSTPNTATTVGVWVHERCFLFAQIRSPVARVVFFSRCRCSIRSIRTYYYLTRCFFFIFTGSFAMWKNFLIPITLLGIRNELFFLRFCLAGVPLPIRSVNIPFLLFEM